MNSKLKYFVLLACLGLMNITMAQDGDYYLTHHNPPTDLVDKVNFSLVQDSNGIMWIANRKGIIQYDGVNWRLIPTPSAIFTLTIAENNTIYGAGRNIIGMITYNDNNQLDFSTIAEGPSINDISSSLSHGNKVLFLTGNKLHIYDHSADSLETLLEETGLKLQGLHKHDNNILISSEEGELLKLNETFSETSPYIVFDSLSLNTGVQWISQPSDQVLNNQTVIIDSEGFLHLAKGDDIHQLSLDDDDYVRSSIPMEAIWLEESLFAVSTLSGGVVFINPDSSKIEKIVNYHTGLPDNQVFSMTKDMDQGIWVAHDYGLTRIDALIPLRGYGNFPGLDGNILAVTRYQGKLYVGTNLGVYYLDEVKDYEEVEFFVKTGSSTRKSSLAAEERTESKTVDSQKQPKEEKKKKKGLFSFLKKKDDNDEQQAETPQQEAGDEKATEKDEPKKKQGFFQRLFGGKKDSDPDKTEWEKRTKRELLSIRYIFKKIEDIPAKTEILITGKDLLLTGGLSGIHQIKENEAITISDIPVRHAYFSEENNMLFASTYDNEILSFSYEAETWEPVDILEGLEDFVFQITEQDNSMWLVSADSLYRIELEERELVDVDVFAVNNPYFEETYAVSHQSRLYFLNSAGYFYYDPSERRIKEDLDLKESWGLPERLFVGGGNNIWIYNGKVWNTIGTGDFNRENYDFLNIFPEIRQLYYSEEDDRFWVVTMRNMIYEIMPPQEDVLISRNNIYLREIRKQNNLLRPDARLRLQLENSSLTFNFIQPDYSRLMGIEYQYKLAGLSELWSEWDSNNNIITFSYLPAGDYALEFQTRDIFGNVNSIQPIEFRIIDPYWRRPWFYAIEVAFFSMLLYLSIRLNRGNTRYRIVSRLLAFLTLILIIEFIQTAAEYKFETEASPVIDFFIQVSIALVVLPFESLLRRAIFRSRAVETSFADLTGKNKSKKQNPDKELKVKSK